MHLLLAHKHTLHDNTPSTHPQHAELRDPPPLPRHPPCALSSSKRFPAPGVSIKNMFAKAAAAKQQETGAGKETGGKEAGGKEAGTKRKKEEDEKQRGRQEGKEHDGVDENQGANKVAKVM